MNLLTKTQKTGILFQWTFTTKMNIDTRYVTGDLARDTQFIRDNLTNADKAMIEAQLRLIMSVGSGKMEANKGEVNGQKI